MKFCKTFNAQQRRRVVRTFTARFSALQLAATYSVDGSADQLERVVGAELDRVAPLRRCRRRPSKPITRWLSPVAISAKRQRRRLERRWQHAELDTAGD